MSEAPKKLGSHQATFTTPYEAAVGRAAKVLGPYLLLEEQARDAAAGVLQASGAIELAEAVERFQRAGRAAKADPDNFDAENEWANAELDLWDALARWKGES